MEEYGKRNNSLLKTLGFAALVSLLICFGVVSFTRASYTPTVNPTSTPVVKVETPTNENEAYDLGRKTGVMLKEAGGLADSFTDGLLEELDVELPSKEKIQQELTDIKNWLQEKGR